MLYSFIIIVKVFLYYIMSNPSYYVGIAEPGNVIASSTSTSLSFTGLTANTTYSMYVIGIYANNTITSIGTYSFTTSPADTVIQTSTFAYTGADQTFTVPTGTTYVTAQLWGAGGGSGAIGNTYAAGSTLANGGGGGYTTANLTVTSGTVLTVIVGQAGYVSGIGGQSLNTYGGGGGCANLNGDNAWRNSSGGGRSAIQISSADIITAGGGGGGGHITGTVNGYTCAGGAGGGLIGGSGGPNDPDTSFDGKGGTQSAGGAAGTGQSTATAGSQYQGGTGSQYAAGGGGGWYGGGGAVFVNINTQSFGGGGGGSSYVSGTYLQAGTSATLTQASGSTVAANTSLPAGVQGTIGGGGAGSTTGSAGQNGYVVLKFYATTSTYVVFTPKLVNGLNLWWDGSDPLNTGTAPSNGSTVATWFDKGGNGYNAPATTAATYSSTNNSITFSNSFYTSTYPANPTNESVFIVYNVTNTNQPMMMIGANVGGREVAIYSTTSFGILNSNVAWGAVVSGIGTLNQTYLGETFVSGGTSTYASINGSLTLTGPTAVTAFTSGVLTNLGRESTTGQPFYGNIMEILIYNSYLPILERQKIEGYLAWKWGIQANLPSTHPYYSAKPGAIVYPLTSNWTPAYSNLVAYFMLDETTGSTLVKEQISGYNGTVVGGVTFGSAGIVGNSGTFDGSTGYIKVPYQVMNNLSTGTIMCWVYVTNLTSSIIFAKQKDGANTYGVLSIGSLSSTGGVFQAGTAGYVYWHGKNSQAIAAAVSNSAISASVWTHIAVTFSTTYTNIYINGVLSSTTSTDMSIPNDITPTTTSIGGWYSSGSLVGKYTGKIDELSVWNTVLNPSQVFQIYKTQRYGPDTFYLNTSPYLITYYRFETVEVNGTSLTNYATDTVDATLTSATISSTSGNYKIGSSALALTLQYATINRTFTTAQTFSNGVTFACWFSTPAINGNQRIFDFGVSGTSGIAMITDSTTGKLGIYIPSTTVSTSLTVTVVTDGVWRHAVWTINTSGLSTVYINGVSALTVSSTFPSLTMTSNFIGKSNAAGDVNFTGKIDDFRVYNCVLTANDVAQLYAYSGSNPTTSYYPLSTTWTPYYGNLLAYYMLDDAVSSTTVKDQINAYTATVVGAVTFGNTGKLSTCAFFNNLSSSTGYLTLPSLTLTSSNMSFSFWANIPSITGLGETFIELGNSTSDHIRIWLSNTNYFIGTINSSDSNLFLINPYFNQWIHIVVTISAGTNWTVYLNGTSMATVTKTAFTLNTKTLNNIGRSPSFSANPYYYGYLDDFAIWNTALSAAAVSGIYNTQKLAIYNANLYTVPRQGINFELMFGTSTLPTVDNFGSTLTSTGSPTMLNDANRGYVLSCAANQYITTTINTGTGSFSRCFWYYQPVWFNANTLTTPNCPIWFNNTNFLNVRFNYVSGTALTLTDTVNRGAGTWTHYVVTYDSTLLTGAFYANGALIGSGSVTFSETGPLVISSYTNVAPNTATSYYDNIHLYNRALTAAEVTAMYNYELDNPTDSLASTATRVLQTNVFAYTGADQTVTVPAGTSYVTAQLWGAGGGGSGNGSVSTYYNYISGSGGGGGYTTANLTVTSGTVLTVMVGQAGNVSAVAGQTVNTYGGGGGCISLAGDTNWRNTSGGGRSAIRISGADIITAGGGGGGGHISPNEPSPATGTYITGGAGGGLIGGTGGFGDSSGTDQNGKGGTQSAGGGAGTTRVGSTGASTNGTAGSQYQGGTGTAAGAGGGGGWYGGGGSNYSSIGTFYLGAGGGGSSYVSTTYLQSGTTATLTQASGSTVAANTSLPAGVQGTIGGGGAGSTTGSAGQNGYVVLTFYSDATSPSAPTSVSAAAASSTSVTVSFTPPSGTVTSYTVTSSPGSFTGTGSASPITVSGLSSNTSYTFTVTATNSAGTSSASTASSAVITYPGPPTIGTPTVAGSTGASVTFTANTGGGAAAITSYTVTSIPGSFTGSGSTSPISVSGLSSNTSYTFTVTETTSVGISSASTASNAIITYPGPPTIGTATAAGSTGASVTFTANTGGGAAAITSYTVTSIPGSFTGSGSTSPITVGSLSTGVAYTFTVTETTSVGSSTASSASNSVTLTAISTSATLGNTWSSFTPTGTLQFYNRQATATSLNGTCMYYATLANNVPSGNNTYYIVRTTNSGTSWTTTTLVPTSGNSNGDYLGICCTDDGVTVFITTEGGIYKSTNSGSTFVAFNTTYNRLYNICCSSTATYIYILSVQQNCVLYSTNSGSTFTTTTATISGGSTWSLACSSDGQYAFLAGSNSPGFRISNFGATVTPLLTTDIASSYFYNVSISSTGQYMLVLTTTSTLYLSTNYGVSGSWSVITRSKYDPRTTGPLSAVLSRDGMTIIASMSNYITYSHDYGSTFTISTPTTLPVSGGNTRTPTSSTSNSKCLIAYQGNGNNINSLTLYYG